MPFNHPQDSSTQRARRTDALAHASLMLDQVFAGVTGCRVWLKTSAVSGLYSLYPPLIDQINDDVQMKAQGPFACSRWQEIASQGATVAADCSRLELHSAQAPTGLQTAGQEQSHPLPRAMRAGQSDVGQ